MADGDKRTSEGIAPCHPPGSESAMKLRLKWLFVILLPILRAASSIDSKAQDSKAQELPAEAEVELSFPLIAEKEETAAVSPGYLPSFSGALQTIQSRLPEASRRLQRMCNPLIKGLWCLVVLCIVSSFAILGLVGLSIVLTLLEEFEHPEMAKPTQ